MAKKLCPTRLSHGWYDKAYIEELLEAQGINVLNNENVKLRINDREIYIAGVEDKMTASPNLYEALENTKSPTILLTHTPDVFPKVPIYISFTLAVHTHDCQFRLPLLVS